ncbi:unnamed protein product [Urochloa decumbens]|uniref:rRNA N-glycosylase n=1 Tax=Urochloa decumbens TaxID=240449 RepID=A0ABC9DBQ1_9POAL
MDGRTAVALLLAMLVAAAASSLVMLLEHRRPPLPISSNPGKPPFMVVSLRGNLGDMARLALMSHDLSLAGFANRTGYWHLFPGSTLLPFGNSYRDLIGGLANLPNLPVGRALATMTVTECERRRLQAIRDALAKGWTESGSEACVAAEHLPYIEHWDTICYEILRAEKNGVWDGPFTNLLREHTNIKSEEEALAVVSAIANRTLTGLLMAHARRA